MLAKELKEILANVPDDAVVVASDINWREIGTTGGQYLKDRNTFYIDIYVELPYEESV